MSIMCTLIHIHIQHVKYMIMFCMRMSCVHVHVMCCIHVHVQLNLGSVIHFKVCGREGGRKERKCVRRRKRGNVQWNLV